MVSVTFLKGLMPIRHVIKDGILSETINKSFFKTTPFWNFSDSAFVIPHATASSLRTVPTN